MFVLASISSQLTSAIGDHGLYAIFGLMALDAVFPAGSELVMLYGGALAAGAFASSSLLLFGTTIPVGAGGFVAVGLAGTLGYLVGAIVGWVIGARGGRALLERRGRLFHLPPERVARADAWFGRFGRWAVLLGRVTPLVRSFVSIPAGALGSPLGSYTVLTLVGSLLWAFALAGVGYGLGNGYERFDHAFHYADYAILAAIALTVLVAVGARLVRRRRTPRP